MEEGIREAMTAKIGLKRKIPVAETMVRSVLLEVKKNLGE